MFEFKEYENTEEQTNTLYAADLTYKLRCTKCKFQGTIIFPVRITGTKDMMSEHFREGE